MITTKTVSYKGQVIAHFYFKNLKTNGVRFLSPDDYSLQLGIFECPTGHVFKKHIHRTDIKVEVPLVQEYLYIVKGKVKVNLFSNKWKLLKSVILAPGDSVMFVSGGHGLEVLLKCRIITVKQGPWPGEVLKIYPNEKEK